MPYQFMLSNENGTAGDTQMPSKHFPVMSQEILEYLKFAPSSVFVDCTLGMGGHAGLVASKMTGKGRIIAIDRDGESLAVAQEHMKGIAPRCDFIQDDFRHIDKILEGLNIPAVDGILLDLGISSFQLDNPQRGFSFQKDGPLDMRLDQGSFISAYDLVNSLSENEIDKILKEYGEERWHHRIARFITQRRPIQSTQELREVVVQAVPAPYRRQRIHPATRTFQAFRIVVNRELESLEMVIERGIDYLKPGARIGVISFHSLEDRIVKQGFRKYALEKKINIITKKPLSPGEDECGRNPRARSAKLRVAERI